MSSVKIFVGLDYHQEMVQLCVLDETGRVLTNRSLLNNADVLIKAAERWGVVEAAAIEACCGAANLAQELVEKGWSVSLAHPGFVARMKQNRDKTDYGDARLLADLLRVGYLPKVWLAPERVRQLRRLVRYRRQLVDQRRNVKLRIRAVLRENRLKPGVAMSAWTKRWLAWLETEADLQEQDRWIMAQHLDMLQQLSQKIREADAQLTKWAEDDLMIAQLLTMPGVGLITAVTLRAEVGRFDRFQTGKQLAKFCGVSPRNASSGERQADAGLIQSGNPQLRSVLIELAQRLAWRMDSQWSKLAQRLGQKGKKRNVIVAAVANRFIRWLYHQMQPEKLAMANQMA
jgi:transposase